MVRAHQQPQQGGAGDEGQPRHTAVRTPQEAPGHRAGTADRAAQIHPRTVRDSCSSKRAGLKRQYLD